MRGEIVAIGDELIRGRVRETNAGYAAGRLWNLGIEVSAVVVVGDEPAAMADAIGRAVKRADFVLVTGGLGATDDDVTAGVAAEVFGLPLAESERMVTNLREFFQARGRDLTDEALRMAQLPLGAEVLSATSAGFKLTTQDNRPVFFLPGIPYETRLLLDQKVLPELLALAGQTHPPLSRELRVFGLGESEVGRRLGGLTEGYPAASVGFYPVFPEVQVVITLRGLAPNEAKQQAERLMAEARRRLEPYVVAGDGRRLEEAMGRDLVARGWRLAVAESCTGGLVGHRITSVAGSSDFFERGVVVYSNQAKQDLLGVRSATLETFGAVSAETAGEMAAGMAQSAGVEVALSVTGIAGPSGGSREKPVGTVWFGCQVQGEPHTERRRFHGTRRMVKAQAAEHALHLVRRRLAGR